MAVLLMTAFSPLPFLLKGIWKVLSHKKEKWAVQQIAHLYGGGGGESFFTCPLVLNHVWFDIIQPFLAWVGPLCKNAGLASLPVQSDPS